MQNRLATAILMSLGGALDTLKTSGVMNKSVSGDLLELVGDYTTRLLKGEIVNTKGEYEPMELTATNIVQRGYNEVAADFLYTDNILQEDIGGYRE